MKLATAFLMTGAIAFGQQFTAASIRPSAAQVQFEHEGKTEIAPGLLTMRDVTVDTCVKFAYGVQNSQIAGPEWMDADDSHFDIQARAGTNATPDQMREMMKALLAERFGLKFHHETREITAYALTAPKGSDKLHESAPGTQLHRENTAISTIARGISMHEFADFISQPLHMPVIDQTGLPARYDFTLDFTSYLPGNGTAVVDNGNGIIISALQGELGLKLESKKQPVDVMVIDHAERPSAN